MAAPSLRGEIFALLKLRGWPPKSVATFYRACNKGFESPHLLGAMLQLSDGCAPPPVTHAIQLARHGAPQDSYIAQASQFIRETEEWLQLQQGETINLNPQSLAPASSAEMPAK